MTLTFMPNIKFLSLLVQQLWPMLKSVVWPLYLTFELEGWPCPWHVTPKNLQFHEIHMHAQYLYIHWFRSYDWSKGLTQLPQLPPPKPNPTQSVSRWHKSPSCKAYLICNKDKIYMEHCWIILFYYIAWILRGVTENFGEKICV